MAVSIAVACIYLWDAITRRANFCGGARFHGGGFSLLSGFSTFAGTAESRVRPVGTGRDKMNVGR